MAVPTEIIPIIVVSITALAAVVAAALTFLAAYLKLRADGKSLAAQLDKAIDERIAGALKDAWAEIDELKERLKELHAQLATDQETHTKQMSAVARILRAIARQWPDDHGPDLDPGDIALIEDTIPAHWIRRQETS